MRSNFWNGDCRAQGIRVSVCMAARNGGKFIGEQIASILPQLEEQDELVIVDDASNDNTVAIVEEFRDERIRIVRHERQCGVIRTFSHALQESKGGIVFLADQDDVWRADKVAKFMEVFRTRPEITAALSDLVTMDASGKVISGPKFASKRFQQGVLHNLARNQYQGSAMAFRRSILKHCLPFPSDIPIHDVWIGLVNELIGKTAFIPEPLLFYRRHASNESPDRHAPIPQMIRWRWALAKNLTVFLYREWLRRIAGHPTEPGAGTVRRGQ